jgi:ADP-ribose pyrophosphatase
MVMRVLLILTSPHSRHRPPVDAICVELPAGLVDAEEDAAKAGERELYEETGYKGTTEEVSPVIVSDPGACQPAVAESAHSTNEPPITSMAGMTSANMCISTVKVELREDEELKEPEQHLDEGEYIEKRIVAMKDLYQTLLGECARPKVLAS